MIVGLHHFGIEVNDLSKAAESYQRLGFKVFMKFSKESIGAQSIFLKKNNSGIELWKFRSKNKTTEMIKRHFAFESTDIETDLQDFLLSGFTLAMPISNGTVVKRFAYVCDSKNNYIELVEPLDEN